MGLKDYKTEYRSTKEIIETMAKRTTDGYEVKYIFHDMKMFLGARNAAGDIVEIKITMKKDRLLTTEVGNVDPFLQLLTTKLTTLFDVKGYKNGIVVHDTLKDYLITLVRKKNIIWNRKENEVNELPNSETAGN